MPAWLRSLGRFTEAVHGWHSFQTLLCFFSHLDTQRRNTSCWALPTMEVAGATVGGISLALQLHEKFKNSTNVFHELRKELKSFQSLQRIASTSSKEHSDILVIQTGCYNVIFDIQRLLIRYNENTLDLLQQLRWSFEDVEQLRHRLTRHTSMLGTCAR